MENSASTIDAPKIPPTLSVTPQEAADAVPVQVNEKRDAMHKIHRFIQAMTYPVAVLSGMWMVNRDVHESTYQNLKRYGAFDDVLNTGEGGGLGPRNHRNVQDRISGKIDVATFLEKSHETKIAYRDKMTERMTHMGLGAGYSNFRTKWNYISRVGKADALFKGATVTGIVAVALSVANSQKLIEMMKGKGEEKSL